MDSQGNLSRDASGQLARVKGNEEVREDIQVGTRVFRGEAPMSLSLGVPWLALLAKGVSPERLGSTVQRAIERRPGVLSVTSIAVTDQGDRVASISYEAQVSAEALAASMVSDTLDLKA